MFSKVMTVSKLRLVVAEDWLCRDFHWADQEIVSMTLEQCSRVRELACCQYRATPMYSEISQYVEKEHSEDLRLKVNHESHQCLPTLPIEKFQSTLQKTSIRPSWIESSVCLSQPAAPYTREGWSSLVFDDHKRHVLAPLVRIGQQWHLSCML